MQTWQKPTASKQAIMMIYSASLLLISLKTVNAAFGMVCDAYDLDMSIEA